MSKQTVDVSNALVAPREGYVETLEAITAGGFCPFCEEHLTKHHSRPIIERTDHWIVTTNAWPYEGTAHHFLLIPRKHVEAIEQLSPDAWTDLQLTYKRIVTNHCIRGAALLMRSGKTDQTGASVTHLHAHIFVGGPRTETSEPIKALVAFKK